MRNIQAQRVTDVVRRLCIEANCHLTDDLKNCITACRACEPFPVAQGILDQIIENYQIADQNNVPVCQDTGYVGDPIRTVVLLPHGKVTPAQLAQPLGSGAQVLEVPGVFDDCMKVVEYLADHCEDGNHRHFTIKDGDK